MHGAKPTRRRLAVRLAPGILPCELLPARFGPAAARVAATVVPTAAARVFGFGPCLVDREAAAAHLMLVQLGDGFLSLFVRAHLHERESARAAGGHIAHHLD